MFIVRMRIKFSKLYRVKSCFSFNSHYTQECPLISFCINLPCRPRIKNIDNVAHTIGKRIFSGWFQILINEWLALTTLTMILHLLFPVTPLINCWSNLGKHTVRLATQAPTEIRSFWGKLLSRLEVKEEEKLKSFDRFLSEIICSNFNVWTLLMLCNICNIATY